jgi:hypothetical protein
MVENEKYTFKNILYYIQGHVRYSTYYSPFYWLIPIHIREQILYRINSMNPICYERGSCIACGCKTTHLQMCDKPCNNNCYPKMLNKTLWHLFKGANMFVIDTATHWSLDIINKKFIKI